MKRWIWAVLVFLVAGVVGGYSLAHYHENELQYNRDIVNGETAIEQKNYVAAENYFSRALTKKKDDEAATDLLAQTKKYVRAESEFKNNEFTSARMDYRVVKMHYDKGSKTLKQQAQARVNLIDKIKKNVKDFNNQLEDAKMMNAAWNFYGSNATIDGLLSNSDFTKKYYQTLYDQALILQRFNNAGIVADQSSFSTDTTIDSDQTKSAKRANASKIPQYNGPGPVAGSSTKSTSSTSKPASKSDASSTSTKAKSSSKTEKTSSSAKTDTKKPEKEDKSD
jgi:hypothetical protein